jgi:hypothetical protein
MSLICIKSLCLCFVGPLVESLKTVEIEKCKKDIAEIREQIHKTQKKMGDYAMTRYAETVEHLWPAAVFT